MSDKYSAVGKEWESKQCDPLADIKVAMEMKPIPRQDTYFLPKSLVDHYKEMGYVVDDDIKIITLDDIEQIIGV